MPAVTVLGGGFAGLAAVNRLLRHRRRCGLRIRLVDRRAESVFAPVLPDIISQRVRSEHLLYPLEPYCRRHDVEFVQAEVRRFLPDRPAVETDHGVLEADYLVICLGCENNFYGNRQMSERAIGLKTTEDGRRIQEKIREAIRGGNVSPERKPHILVVGGGYTGFEAASHAAYLAHTLTELPYGELHRACPVTILEKAPDVLRNVSPFVHDWALRLIAGYGVTVRTGMSADALEDGATRLSDGSLVPNALVIWSAGVTPGGAVAALNAPKGPMGRLAVDQYLRVPDLPHAFAAGDVAGAVKPGEKAPLRLSVQFSLMGGACAAENVVRTLTGKPLRIFDPADLGYVVPLAPGEGAGVVLGHELHGRIPIFLHYFMSMYRSWNWANRWGMLRDLIGGPPKE